MKGILLVLCSLVLLPGCSYLFPVSNQPPEAYITSISPEQVTEGDIVTFAGYGTDPDGEVVGYLWTSDIDGELSRSPTFETDSLSVGEHSISFTVQDNNGAWSDEVHGSVEVLPEVAEPATIDSFSATPSHIQRGDSLSLSWDVSNATTVFIDQGIGTVATAGSVEVSPEVTTTYKLTAIGGGTTVTAEVTVTVQDPWPSITLTPVIDLTGFVRSSGVDVTGDIFVGDDDANRGIQGFVTYNISGIPADAIIRRVVIDMSGYQIPYHPPFPDLGCLGAFVHDFPRLHGQYRWQVDADPIERWCFFDELDTPTDSVGFRDALQEKVGKGRFQLRLQFADMHTDGDNLRDMLHWPRAGYPALTVEYELND